MVPTFDNVHDMTAGTRSVLNETVFDAPEPAGAAAPSVTCPAATSRAPSGTGVASVGHLRPDDELRYDTARP